MLRIHGCARLLLLVCCFSMNSPAQEKVDLEMINRIRYEGFRNSKVMEIAGEPAISRIYILPDSRSSQWTDSVYPGSNQDRRPGK